MTFFLEIKTRNITWINTGKTLFIFCQDNEDLEDTITLVIID